MYLELIITRNLSFSCLKNKDNEAEQLVSSQAACVLIGSACQYQLKTGCSFIEWIGAPILLLILVSSCQCKSERLCGWERICFFFKVLP